ncbi:MAG: hypothetical protein IKS20_01055 [Victivallales bacterium]|nr:hypothetical protein [Victivallales bacterium]
MPFEIKDKDNAWTVRHSAGRCGGPRLLEINGTPVLKDIKCIVDGQSDDTLHSKKAHVFHKAGQSIFECDGTFKGGQSYAQSCRYAGNSVRITWDFNWPKDTPVMKSVEIGSAVLPGEWSQVYVVNAEPVPGLPYPGIWKSLTPGEILFFDKLPASLVFERNDGVRLEYSLGFDLWRWNYGLGVEGASTLTLQVGMDGITLTRRIAQTQSEEGVLPEAREYRFMAIISWSWPGMEQMPEIADAQELPLLGSKQGLDLSQYSGGPVCLDYAKLPCVEEAFRSGLDAGAKLPCLETSQAISALKRCIRQLAETGKEGTLVIRNLEPGFCNTGSHVTKKGSRLHWDLYDILTFASWAKNCLGEGWRLCCPQELWHELPSLAGLHLPNGYVAEE